MRFNSHRRKHAHTHSSNSPAAFLAAKIFSKKGIDTLFFLAFFSG